ncbi:MULTISPECIES: sugar transferase [unclassified Exiguobacterium]|uniref:sugar transferase n=1 Tax=unclassified Exiguobacterium TaxID=2644629 RepID=UPI002036B6F5|nr:MULTISPECIES: sugar transferase [unclassified Exiguobacterium]
METLKENVLTENSNIVNEVVVERVKLKTIKNSVEQNHLESFIEYKNKNIFFEISKRFIDILISLLLILITVPVVILFSILIKIESNGPILYRQDRLGRNNNIFTIYKLRSMYSDAERDGAKWAKINDSRITRIGSIIRKTRIDELPQLFNVLKGEMSLIGPRPERKIFADEFTKINKDFSKRLSVKPGLTGLAQVKGGYDLTPFEKLEYDLKYIKNRDFKMEFFIMLSTIKVIVTGEGAR